MARRIRVVILAICNWLYWLGMFALIWHHVIPERLTLATFLFSQLFALPIGCCSLVFLIHAQLHETGWRLFLSGGVTLVNGAIWAWCIDWLWRRYSDKASAPGFPVRRSNGDDADVPPR